MLDDIIPESVLLIGVVLCSIIGPFGMGVLAEKLLKSAFQAEKTKRQTMQDKAQLEYDRIVAQMQRMTEVFYDNKLGLARLRDEYRHLPEREKAEIANLHATVEARQKQQFLEHCFIDAASIPGVDQNRKAALQSFGIETAADVTRKKVFAVEGFGIALTQAVLEWRRACERKFVFDPRLAVVNEADKDAVRARFAARKRTLETKLTAGAVELQRLHQETVIKADSLILSLLEAGQNLAQARADLNICH